MKEKIEVGLINLSHVSSSNQVAVILTKGLTRRQFKEFKSKLGMEDIYHPAPGEGRESVKNLFFLIRAFGYNCILAG